MRKRTKRQKIAMIIALLLAALMILPMVISALVPAASAKVTVSQKDIDKQKENQAYYQKQQKEAASKIKQLKNEKADVVALKAALDEEIDLIEKQIENNDQLIDNLNIRLNQQQEELGRAIEREREAADLFRLRLRAMEETGSVSYLSILFEAASFSDMLGRLDLISEIMEADERVMASLAQAREEVEAAKAVLEQDKEDLRIAGKELLASQAELSAQYDEYYDLINQLNQETAETVKVLEEAEREEEKAQKEFQRLLAQRQKELEAQKKKNEYVGGEYLFPVPGATIGSGEGYKFGWRMHPILKRQQFHGGVDIPAKRGTPIVAANSGTVIVVDKHYSYGNYVVIDHGGGNATLYAHMSKITTSLKKEVARGEKIGEVGSTGVSTGDHLHFEIIINGKQVDPEPRLRGK